jgi:hypothetical protein
LRRLKAAFDAPTITGIGPYTHEFCSGGWVLPSLSIETAIPEVPRHAMYTGGVMGQLSWQMTRAGLLTATMKLMAQGESVVVASSAGTPSAIPLQRFGHFNGAIRRNGVDLGNVVSAEVAYATGLDRIEARFSDTTLVSQSIDGTPCDLSFGWALPTGESLTLTAHAVYLLHPRIEISGPQGMQANFLLASRSRRRVWAHAHGRRTKG